MSIEDYENEYGAIKDEGDRKLVMVFIEEYNKINTGDIGCIIDEEEVWL